MAILETRKEGNSVDYALSEWKGVSVFLREYKTLETTANNIGDLEFLDSLLQFRRVYNDVFPTIEKRKQECVELHASGLSHGEIGAVFGITKQAVQRNLQSACEELAKRYAEYYIK